MVAAWEFWTLVALAGLQIYVAYRWWTGSHLPGTRGWIAALFALNATYMAFSLVHRTGGPEIFNVVDGLADRWTNLALLGFGAVALDVDRRRTRFRRAILVPVVVVAGAGTTYVAWHQAAGLPPPGWKKWFTLQVLLAAIVVGAVALAVRFRRWDEGPNPLWGLALAAVGLRYAELTTWLFNPQVLQAPNTFVVSKAAALLVVAGATLVGAARYATRRPSRARRTYELALALLAAGFLFGLARRGSNETYLGLVLTFALVRPVLFLEIQARLDGAHLWSHPVGRPLAVGAGGLLAILLGVGFGAVVDLGFAGRVAAGAAFLAPGAWGAHALITARPLQPSDAGGAGTGSVPDWPVEEDRVTLPPDWEGRLEEAYRAYQDQPEDVRDALDGLAYWERLILALDGAPDEGKVPAYERTTPGLHLWTHCNYSSIGSELDRASERADVICEALDVPTSGPGGTSEALVEETWGRAEGLESARAKVYDLTPLGERVAQALREKVGLPEADPEEVARLVPAGFRAVER